MIIYNIIKSGLYNRLYNNNIKYLSKIIYYRNYSINNISNNTKDYTGKWRQNVVGAQEFQNLKVGPYRKGRWLVSFKEDPGSFITNMLIFAITGYTIFTLTPGESMITKRRRKIRQEILEEYGLTEAELEQIEDYKLPPNV